MEASPGGDEARPAEGASPPPPPPPPPPPDVGRDGAPSADDAGPASTSQQQQQAGGPAHAAAAPQPLAEPRPQRASNPPATASGTAAEEREREVELELRVLEALFVYTPAMLRGVHGPFLLLGLRDNLERRLNRRFTPDEVLGLVGRFYDLDAIKPAEMPAPGRGGDRGGGGDPLAPGAPQREFALPAGWAAAARGGGGPPPEGEVKAEAAAGAGASPRTQRSERSPRVAPAPAPKRERR